MRDAQHDATEQQAATVLVEIAGPVARLTLNRPRQRNPLDRVTVAALRDAITRLEEDRSVQVVCLSGAGGTFSAGGDLKGYVDLYRQPEAFMQFLENFWDLLDRIERSAKIYIAVIEGYCVAGGLELLLACDVVVAAESARIGDAHVNFGQLPGAGGSQRLPRVIGPLRAKLLILTGDIIPAQEAERIGLVSKVVPDAELGAAVGGIVDRLLAGSPTGLKGAKHLVNQGMSMPIEDALRMEIAYVHNYATTVADATEGLIAFQEKRSPRFSRL